MNSLIFKNQYIEIELPNENLYAANVANPNVIDGLVYPMDNDATSTAHWNPQHFRFYATDYDRTLFSVFSIAQAMFPLGTGPATDISLNGKWDRYFCENFCDFKNNHYYISNNFCLTEITLYFTNPKPTGQQSSLPNFLQPIPVHTQTSINELWMSAYGKCPAIDQRNEENEQSQEYLDKMQKFKPYLTKLSNWTGIPFQNDLISSSSVTSSHSKSKNTGLLSFWFSESNNEVRNFFSMLNIVF